MPGHLTHRCTLFSKVSLVYILVVDLPSLQVITLGEFALVGRYDNPLSSLVMRSMFCTLLYYELDLPALEVLSSQGKSFSSPHIITLESMHAHALAIRYS